MAIIGSPGISRPAYNNHEDLRLNAKTSSSIQYDIIDVLAFNLISVELL